MQSHIRSAAATCSSHPVWSGWTLYSSLWPQSCNVWNGAFSHLLSILWNLFQSLEWLSMSDNTKYYQRMWNKWNSHMLLVGTMVYSSNSIYFKTKHAYTQWLSNPNSGLISNRSKYMSIKRTIYLGMFAVTFKEKIEIINPATVKWKNKCYIFVMEY